VSITGIVVWLLLTLALSGVAGFAVWSRRETHARALTVVALVVAAPVALFAMRVALGSPDDTTPPPGKYEVHGARIDVDVAIYVLVSQEGAMPVYYRMPYSAATANKLQQAMDAAREGEGPKLEMTESGEAVFHEPPVRADPPKQPEAQEPY
jgi:hypothetical protein